MTRHYIDISRLLTTLRITSRKYYNFTLDAQRKGETVKVFTEAQSWELLMKLLGPDWQDRDRLGQMKSSEDRSARELLGSLGGVSLTPTRFIL
jgi:hypothetical protein